MRLTSDESIVVFFALFWTIGFVPLGEYRLFESHQILNRKKALRFLMGFLSATVLPLAILTWALKVIPYQIAMHRDPWVPGGVVSAALIGLSLPGVRRIVHGVVFPWLYKNSDDRYDQELVTRFEKRWGLSPCPHLLGGLVWGLLALLGAYLFAILLGW
jgi:hypothetical protein